MTKPCFNLLNRVTIPPKQSLKTTTNELANENSNTMELQLVLTLSIGFMLVFANIIAFSLISYRKEKDKILIEVNDLVSISPPNLNL